jgi:hypothetical protein
MQIKNKKNKKLLQLNMGAAKIFPEGRTTRKCPKGVTFKLFKNI